MLHTHHDGGPEAQSKKDVPPPDSAADTPSSGKRTELIVRKSALPIWAAAAVWIVAALFFPMYHFYHYFLILLLSGAVAFVLAKILPPKKEYIEIPEAPPDTGNPDLDEMITAIRTASAALNEVRSAVAVPHPQTAGVLADICRTIAKISAAVEEHPKDLPLVRRCLHYYLPTTVKLAEKYRYLDGQQETGLANIDTTMHSIEEILVTISGAMKKQLDALFADDALDISTDIEVMEAMLARDGLK